jgi:radical SAM superfamily enzyme YgiQ (UPF0313 family)
MLQEKIIETFLESKRFGGLPIALIFPNEYAVAVANLGFNASYRAFEKAGFDCERFIYSDGKIRSVSGNKNILDFKVWAFSLSFELDVMNVFEIFSKTGVEPLAKMRKGKPFVIFGGAMTFFNPNSFWHIADTIFHGEIEGNQEMLFTLHETIEKGLNWSETLSILNDFENVSVPPLGGKNVKLSKIRDLGDSFADSVMLSDSGAFGKTYLVEIERGCIHNCAFCVASKIYSVVRFMSLNEIERRISYALEYTDKVGLVGSSVSDHPELHELLEWLKGRIRRLSVSSLRLDAINAELIGTLNSLGDREITLAPEAGTQKMRDLLNKKINDEDIENALHEVKKAGLKRVKMYFIYGLPGEEQEDLDGIVEIAARTKAYGIIPYVSINPLIPKPSTPFESIEMRAADDLRKRERYLQSNLGKIGVKSKFESVRLSRIQWIISTADKELSLILANSQDRFGSLKKIEKKWKSDPSWKYINNSWKESVFGDLKISKEG